MRLTVQIIIPIFEKDLTRSVVPLLKDIKRLSSELIISVRVLSNNILLDQEARSFLTNQQWVYEQTSETMPELQFRRWCYENIEPYQGRYFFQIHPYTVLTNRFFEIAVGTWENISGHAKSVLNLTGKGKLPKRRSFVSVQRTASPNHTFITDKSGVQLLIKHAVPPNRTPVWLAQGAVLNGTTGVCPTILVRTATEPPVKPEQVFGSGPVERFPDTIRKATFFVTTHHRPEMLKTCLDHLQKQRTPDGWIYNILVSGMADDLGMVVAKKAGVPYIVSPSPTVTSKLNLMLNETKDSVLIMKADDDDIQPPDRLMAAVGAYEEGAAWSGVGTLYFYDIHEDRVMRWKGKAEWGLVGTSMNYNADLLQQVKGWPTRVKGEDGALATLIKKLKAPFQDVTDQMGTIVCCQHGQNLYPRPVVEINGRTTRGGFVIHGEGSLQQSSIPFSIKKLPALTNRPKTPVYKPEPFGPSIKRFVYSKQKIVVGIGVCSYNKPEALTRWAQNLSLIVKQAKKEGILLEPVLSTGDTIANPPQIMNIPCIHRSNLGVAWVKNNALRYMFDRKCDYFFLVEDDCNIPDWGFFHKYILASQANSIHHLMYGPISEWGNTWIKTGNSKNLEGCQFLEYRRKQKPSSTPGVITFHTRHALEVSGGMDMRFVGRGHGHKEWTDRTVKLLQLRDEYPFDHPLWFLEIPENKNVTFERGPSRGMADTKLIARNKNLLETISPQPCYDFLWADVEFPQTQGSHNLWTYLNGKYPYSLVEGKPENTGGLTGDKQLFHDIGISHPADPISICVSLKNRLGMLEGFIDYMNDSVDNPSLYELIITDFHSDDCNIHEVLQKSIIPYKIVPSDGYFSRGKGLHLAALCAQHDLLMFFDIDMAVNSSLYWAWVRRHTSPQKVIFPICYGLHKNAQMVIQGNTKNSIYSNGFWRDEGFGMAAFHRSTYLEVGGWDHRIARWGGEDNDIYWHCKQVHGLEIIRRKSFYLFHRWHPETKDYKDPYGDKKQMTLKGAWRDPMIRGAGKPDPTAVLKGYDD